MVRGKLIQLKDMPPLIREKKNNTGILTDRLSEVETEMLLNELEKNDWVQTKAAEALGISERVLRYKMNKANIKSKK
jgi:two-component system response regulator AtoC